MAPKEPFKVHSLSKHIENTNRGLSADAQYNRRPLGRPAPAIKQEPGAINKSIFGDDDDSDDDSSDSDSSGDEGGADFLRKLSQPATKAAAASKRPSNKLEIADSDAERNNRAKLVKPDPDSSDDSTSDSESDESPKPKANANGVTAKKAPSSSDSTSDSDSSDENETGNAEKPAVAKQSESTSDSETSDSDSDESEPESDAGETSAKTKPVVNGNSPQSSSSSEEDNSSDESESKDGKPAKPAPKQTGSSPSRSPASSAESDQEMADESIHMEDRQPGGQIAPPSVISPDFVLRKSGDGTSGQDVARICSQASMQGKQFWYFTVPSGVPISVVQNIEIPMDASQRGDRAFTHGGQDFGISFDNMAPKSSIQIMIPSADGSHYQAASQQIDQIMQVRRITQLGADGSTVGPSENNAPRPQPKGLKARFKPIGVDTPMGKIGMDSGSGGEDCEMADAPALPTAPQVPPDMSTPKAQSDKPTPKSKKGKRKEAAVEASQQAAVPRSGKRKQPSSEDEAAAAASQLMEESQTAESKTKKPKTARDGSPDLGSEPPLSATSKAKQTPVMPPTIPAPTYSLSGLGSAPAAASSPLTGKAKKSRKAKGEQPVPSSSQSLPPVKKDTPPKVSPVPIPLPAVAAPVGKDVKKGKRGKDSAGNAAGTSSSQQTSPPPSAQASGKKKKKQTAVRAPESKAPA
ncbi:DNA-directed RNA polymerase I subunit RPA34.5 domain-containing protein [Hirsutella rhossiliensis]|uniref:DNA-directed RNA polymerase I subunit RPA34.5 domain-containing protein n=1 Tax=Hirsutella rhossiliensis TaxID=111463 RepID=A0A9P8N114_9HYPO|nr:DNA-directed RNA polymerase I subunit RPA34.5 domain-containing protein [Hirsutella rhossiliensis]KAH0964627.1 DNA-directed RNA polymerase I subunit RPA34.5 domain-containing protein [Hirsutella rhossiliensis]